MWGGGGFLNRMRGLLAARSERSKFWQNIAPVPMILKSTSTAATAATNMGSTEQQAQGTAATAAAAAAAAAAEL